MSTSGVPLQWRARAKQTVCRAISYDGALSRQVLTRSVSLSDKPAERCSKCRARERIKKLDDQRGIVPWWGALMRLTEAPPAARALGPRSHWPLFKAAPIKLSPPLCLHLHDHNRTRA